MHCTVVVWFVVYLVVIVLTQELCIFLVTCRCGFCVVFKAEFCVSWLYIQLVVCAFSSFKLRFN